MNSSKTTSKVTKAELKVRELVLDFMETEYFLEGVKSLRRKYSIPECGFIIDDKERLLAKEASVNYVPQLLKTTESERKRLGNNVNREVVALYKSKLEIATPSITQTLKYFLYFNIVDTDYIFYGRSRLSSLLRIRNLRQDIEEGVIENNQDIFDKTPIAIVMHPETTKRDLLDFVEQKWTEIEARLYEYKLSNTKLKNIKIRPEKSRLRDQIIYDNKDKSYKEVSFELGKKHIYLEQGNIANYKKKIIAKRKAV